MVGTSGSDCDRVLPVTAMARSRPSAMCAVAGGVELIDIGTWPATTAAIAGPAPLYGT